MKMSYLLTIIQLEANAPYHENVYGERLDYL